MNPQTRRAPGWFRRNIRNTSRQFATGFVLAGLVVPLIVNAISAWTPGHSVLQVLAPSAILLIMFIAAVGYNVQTEPKIDPSGAFGQMTGEQLAGITDIALVFPEPSIDWKSKQVGTLATGLPNLKCIHGILASGDDPVKCDANIAELKASHQDKCLDVKRLDATISRQGFTDDDVNRLADALTREAKGIEHDHRRLMVDITSDNTSAKVALLRAAMKAKLTVTWNFQPAPGVYALTLMVMSETPRTDDTNALNT